MSRLIHAGIAAYYNIPGKKVLEGAEMVFQKEDSRYALLLFGFSVDYGGVPRAVSQELIPAFRHYLDDFDYESVEMQSAEKRFQAELHYWKDISERVEDSRKKILSEHTLRQQEAQKTYQQKITSKWSRFQAWRKKCSVEEHVKATYGDPAEEQNLVLPDFPEKPQLRYESRLNAGNIIISEPQISEPFSTIYEQRWKEFLGRE